MGKTMVSLRLEDDLLAWVTAYALQRGVSRSDLLAQAIADFKVDCVAGVPEIRATAKRLREESQPAGPKPTREDFARSTAARAELFSTLRVPESARRWGRNPEKS